MTRRIRRVVAVAGVGGEVPPLEELLGGFTEAGDDAVAVVGDLGGSLEQGGCLFAGNPDPAGGGLTWKRICKEAIDVTATS
jgi:hypothetical protein